MVSRYLSPTAKGFLLSLPRETSVSFSLLIIFSLSLSPLGLSHLHLRESEKGNKARTMAKSQGIKRGERESLISALQMMLPFPRESRRRGREVGYIG